MRKRFAKTSQPCLTTSMSWSRKRERPICQTRHGDFPVYIRTAFFLINLNAARLACRQLGVKDADFLSGVIRSIVYALQP
ncbi:MAG: hypothetical protein ACLR6J_01430 [Parabacteroides merdae]